MYETSIARKSSEGKVQSLWEHSTNVAEISNDMSHFPNTSKLLAYLHDLGKVSAEFQEYINKGGEPGSVIHAWQGAFLSNEWLPTDCASEILIKEIIGFCVTAHHNHLADGVAPDGTTNYFDKFLKDSDPKYFLDEIKGKISESEKAELQRLFEHAKPEVNGLLAQIKEVYKNKSSANFALGLFVKYLFSCLVDADRLDAYLFDINETYSNQPFDWEPLILIFENELSEFPIDSNISIIRGAVSDKCKAAADKETGIYQLSVPTGGGKTLSSFRFALHHSRQYNKKRIIYVIPYLSIIEQTGNTLQDILNLPDDNNVIFEHHSNIVEPEDDKASEIRKLSAARWSSPVILTTMVQFLESVMSAKSGKLRKFASMADSVIIFDEIQSMPIKAIHCFNEVVTFLSKILNATIILCSATQPTLESTQRTNLLLHEEAKLIDCTEEFKGMKRVTVSAESEKDCETASDFILEKANVNGNCLIIVNTRKSALEIYNRLKSKTASFKILHLSTSMCPNHRVQIIHEMKTYLKENEKVICVSTQLIEAGVDISFACVVRAMSGLDSIAQAAGRCNRNGESAVPKIVYTFPLKDENLDRLMDIKSGKEITEQIIHGKNDELDLLDERVMATFYQRYFSGKDDQMDYPTAEGEWIYEMLSGNGYGKRNYKNRTGTLFSHCIPQAFHSAGENFSVIDKNTKSAIVIFGESESLIEDFRKQPTGILTKQKAHIMKKLQKYSVSLYEWEWKKLSEQGALDILDEETAILLLSGSYYSEETGVVLEIIQDDLII
ncbi:CRISPR-associated helicase Cas3' [Aminipila luticellarii]|uniref:CRISPR-associated helicase Cas3 n=1 Tax=Aminipila luticellarii TaxID=2507160 RepID=A0A410PX25_9FIRM|nr:CRISPR-associated helicase Cas3' [Aminipila luticellarii]QAT43426.1 CRISPR-associated helicase Cas3' [Aminipila luticellarii]